MDEGVSILSVHCLNKGLGMAGVIGDYDIMITGLYDDEYIINMSAE